jgi:hypothetical protein
MKHAPRRRDMGTLSKYKDRYDPGFTAVHETGHWLAGAHVRRRLQRARRLRRRHPADKIPTSGCPPDGSKDTCTRDPG